MGDWIPEEGLSRNGRVQGSVVKDGACDYG